MAETDIKATANTALLEEVKEWARKAGKIQLGYFRSGNLDITTKYNSYDVVTKADKESEKLIISKIKERFPSHDILSEESGVLENGSEWKWVIDPLDGTTNYSCGLPVFSISIALEYKGEPVLGVVFAPYLGEMFCAIKGEGALLNDKPIHCSNKTKLNESVVSTGIPVNKKENTDNNFDNMFRVGIEVRGLRRLGSAAIDLCYAAAGFLDGYWEMSLHRWDISAGMLIAAEAGAKVEFFRPEREYSIIASAPGIYSSLRELIV